MSRGPMIFFVRAVIRGTHLGVWHDDDAEGAVHPRDVVRG